MPANPLPSYFLVPPSISEVLAKQADLQAKSAALIQIKRRSKLERAIPTISVFLRESTLSLEKICDALSSRHQLSVNKSTLWRFIKSQPILATIRQSKQCEQALVQPRAIE